MSDSNANDERNGTDRDSLLMVGGVALLVLGAGILLTNKNVRRLVGNAQPGDLIGAAIPDLERYMKLRAM